MRIELTLQQFRKLSHLDSATWDELIGLLKGGGTGAYVDRMESLRTWGIIRRLGPVAAVRFLVDGEIPSQKTGYKKHKRAASEEFCFAAIWRKAFERALGDKWVAENRDRGYIKKFMANYSVEEFRALVESYLRGSARSTFPALADMWRGRIGYGPAEKRGSFYEELKGK